MAKKKQFLNIPDLSADSRRFIEDLQKETDRGAALIGAAFLDNVLESMLRAYFVDDKKVVNELLNSNNLLGTLSVKGKLAYCLGLIGRENYRDINVIRKIRNEFAHVDKPVSFNMPEVKDLCQGLISPKVINPVGKLSNRDIFIMSVVLVSNQLLLCGLPLKHRTRRKDFTLGEVVKA
jgi:DNA-binding MltR family transcriptional regulator